MGQIRFNDIWDGNAIARHAGIFYNPKCDIVICHADGNRRLGGVLYTNFTGESITCHTASWDRHWITRDMIYVCFDYPFNQLGAKRIFGNVPEYNEAALRFNRHMGFKTVARVEGVHPGGLAAIVMVLEKADCKLLSVRPREILERHKVHAHGR